MQSLSDASVIEVMRAQPATVITNSGKTISYPFRSPEDWRDVWIYFLLVDRFNNPSLPPQPNEIPCSVYQGGNFAGIIQQLPYLKQLGVGAIWVSPVLINPQWFNDYWGGYGIFDFTRIEPRFCSDYNAALNDPTIADTEFRRLVDEAHAEGMYVILDIVLNHTGDLFNYEGAQDTREYREFGEYDIYWRNEAGIAQGDRMDIATVQNLTINEGVWPKEFQRNAYFRRKGGNDPLGDFSRLKELATDYQDVVTGAFEVRQNLILAYQYLIAKFDLDGYRIDTLQYIEPEFAHAFGNAMREYALSIGKKNFFTFGEVWQDDDEVKIARFIGRDTEKDTEFIGVDAALDFPMRKRLAGVCKGLMPPTMLATHFDHRRTILKKIISAHGDAGKYYVTFLDNHDMNERFHNSDLPEQTAIALTCLMTMQGIPCIYYGTEQGLNGHGDRREYVREALWGIPGAFTQPHDFFKLIHDLTLLRNKHPALRYGRQYFRECSGDGVEFGYSPFTNGIISFSRILNDKELLVAANTNLTEAATVYIIVDQNINAEGKQMQVFFPFNMAGILPGVCETINNTRVIKITVPAGCALVIG